MEIVEDRWLAGIFGYPVFRVALSPAELPPSGALRDHARLQTSAFYYAKIDTARIDQLRALAAGGFQVVDVNITLRLGPPWPVPAATAGVSEVRPDEESAVVGIAGRCFTTSRFHLDPSVPGPVANRIKSEWIANYFRKERGERLYAARVESRTAGFLAVLASPSERGIVRVIDLIGVDPPFQGRGVGRSLIAQFIREEGPRSIGLEVGTQAANTRSLRLYGQMGFLVARTQYVMHRHVSPGSTAA
jgi:ribosomal protein S18 acetylase RimI-like enzyme